MSQMQLHEDSPVSDYVIFPIIEIDSAVFGALSGAHITEWTTQATARQGNRLTLRCLNNVNIYTSLSADCPRNALQNGSIIKNKNNFENVQGVYKRTETEVEAVPIGVRPSDWGTSTHYYTQSINTPTTQIPNQYLVYNSVPPHFPYTATTQYYKDISQKEKRMARTFYSDGKLSFTCFSGGAMDSNTVGRKFLCVGSWLGSGYSTNDYFRQISFWTYDGTVYNPQSDNNTNTSNFARTFITGDCVYPQTSDTSASIETTAKTLQSLESVVSCALCFVHTKYNNTDYYGIAYLRYNEDSETAIPTHLTATLFAPDFWGTSIIAGGSVPTGSWGPVSSQSGGSGSWDNTDDSASINVPLPIASLPNALTVGGLHAYLMTEPMLDKLSGLMYNPTTFNNFWSKWLNQKFNPISGIISIHKLPFALQPTGTETFVRIAGAVLDATYMSDLGACLGDLISSQYTETPEYAVSLPEYFGSFYDYDPYTKCYLHLPACGIIKISANEILAGSVSVKYRCDIITGNVCAIVKTTDRNSVVKTHFVTGNCAYKMPFIGRDDGGVDNLVSLISGGISLLSGNVAGAIGAGKAIAEREHSTTITGDCTGNLTPLSDLKLWLEVVRVVPSTPENKQEMQGIPANVYTLLYSISGTGYAEIETIHLENIPDATQEEIAEIENILKNGAVF